ncbi:hypothetical protein AA103196_1330 [Ameyamaea chiangmaiensis NBRC 103196]|uniref:Acyltransferase n=1 Tax=Ameyamaea chiangmaiensis TaxID=442969 RepID=A0A850PCF3_9PROT|nr:acyltransferase [Ameyamaea chiangmaiensis]MBS4075152.1 acyltransferase [Ameyamaea chiangmaiensis]NVN40200.1 acyltransferase [Ameyamaea chiangmaiensis]GBQ66246.1 hypothetical protein AA103196_1330 [Ameyamaea chiangmaiensis NBRC 103196]
MTTTSTATTDSHNPAIDLLRASVTLAVVCHHAVLAYCSFSRFDGHHILLSTAPVVDPQRWVGFDRLVALNDTYFMALMFLVSGLFVLPSLRRKGYRAYLLDRALRLGVPFVACVTLVMPVAYYPAAREAGYHGAFPAFWPASFTDFGWPAGPAWFLWLLLLFDACVVCLGLALPVAVRALAACPDILLTRPVASAVAILVGAILLYCPAAILFGETRWWHVGPFFVQESRVGLYAAAFALGCAAGAGGIAHPLFRRDGPVARGWRAALVFALASFAGLRAVGSPALFAACCVGFCLGITGLFLRTITILPPWIGRGTRLAYGVYLLHDPVVTWCQYVLLATRWGAIPKAVCVIGVTLSVCCGVTRLARCSGVVWRVL